MINPPTFIITYLHFLLNFRGLNKNANHDNIKSGGTMKTYILTIPLRLDDRTAKKIEAEAAKIGVDAAEYISESIAALLNDDMSRS